jgi:hypothetical protein
MRVRAHSRKIEAAALRRFLYQISDDYARRPPPPLIFFKIYKPEFAHKNPSPDLVSPLSSCCFVFLKKKSLFQHLSIDGAAV